MRLPQILNIAFVALLAGSCSSARSPGDPASQSAESAIVQIAGDTCAPLMAGAVAVGTVCTSIDGDNLKVTFESSGTFTMVDARLWVGTDLAGLKTDSNNYPLISEMPYQSGYLDHVTKYDFLVPLASFDSPTHAGACEPKTIYVVPKARVMTRDGAFVIAWGGDVAIGETALYFDISLTCSQEPPPPDADVPTTCETAYAYGAGRTECFRKMDGLKSNNWGGSIGPLDSGTYTFDLYAGGGRCDLNKATFVGWLHVEHNYATGTKVCFEAAAGAVFEETHLYVGMEPLPRDKKGNFTVAPGLYPYSHELNGATSDCYEIDGTGYVYIIAHAVTCYGEDPGIDIEDGYAGGIQR